MSANENHTADASNMVDGGSNSLPPSHEQLRPKIRQQLNDEMRSSLTGWLALLGPSSPKAPAACRPRSATFAHDRGPADHLTASLDHGLAGSRDLLASAAGSADSGGCYRRLLRRR
jgi:hypothetical protein